MSTLSERQQKFIAEYLSDPDRNATAAATRAGYSEKNARFYASRLLANEQIVTEIQRQRKIECAKYGVDEKFVVGTILQSIRTCQKSGTGAWQTQGIQRGAELLARILGMTKDPGNASLDDQIIEQLHRGRARAAGLLKDQEEEQAKPEEPKDPKPN